MKVDTILEILILIAILFEIGLSCWFHHIDSTQEKDQLDEEIEVLNQIADAVQPPEEIDESQGLPSVSGLPDAQQIP